MQIGLEAYLFGMFRVPAPTRPIHEVQRPKNWPKEFKFDSTEQAFKNADSDIVNRFAANVSGCTPRLAIPVATVAMSLGHHAAAGRALANGLVAQRSYCLNVANKTTDIEFRLLERLRIARCLQIYFGMVFDPKDPTFGRTVLDLASQRYAIDYSETADVHYQDLRNRLYKCSEKQLLRRLPTIAAVATLERVQLTLSRLKQQPDELWDRVRQLADTCDSELDKDLLLYALQVHDETTTLSSRAKDSFSIAAAKKFFISFINSPSLPGLSTPADSKKSL